MKILLIADRVHKALYDHFQPDRWQDVDLILSAGDLKPSYLSFLVTLIRGAPLYYVRGNHDDRYEDNPPLGCEDIHARIVNCGGLKMLGLEGSGWYNGQGVQYRERQMRWLVYKMWPRFLLAGPIDLILTHAPPASIADSESHSHRGFKVYDLLIDRLKPRYFIHGHIHLNYGVRDRIQKKGDTTIVNAFEYHVLEIAPEQ